MGLLGTPKEKRTQLFFRDDNRVQFRKLEFDGTALVEKENNVVVRAFKHYYKSEFPFKGYKKIGADRVTLGFGRDIVLDPFGILSPDERPPKHGGLKSPYITQIGADKRYKLSGQKTAAAIWDKLTVCLLIIDTIFALTILVKILVNRNG